MPAAVSPGIRIVQGRDGVAIEQHRPAVLSSLTGLPVERALELVPNLLPVCGMAQSVAASRAVDAARGETLDESRETARERQLWLEQAMSAGWRLAVEWPDLLDRPRALVWLKVLRNSESDENCAGVLQSALPGLQAVWSVEDLADWARSGENHAAGIIRQALAHDQPVSVVSKRLTGAALADTARSALGRETFDPLAPTDDAVEVGPLAMARDPLIARHSGELAATLVGRLQALVLDLRQIIGALRGEKAAAAPETRAWQESAKTGTGCATTARGPVFHRVTLDQRDKVLQWRALAPTDWHFAPRGPVANALEQGVVDTAARLAIAGFDPCAPWTLEQDGGH